MLGPVLSYRSGEQGRQPCRVWRCVRCHPSGHVPVGAAVRQVHGPDRGVQGVRVRGAGYGSVRVPVRSPDLREQHLGLPGLLICFKVSTCCIGAYI